MLYKYRRPFPIHGMMMKKPSEFNIVKQPAGSKICSACVVAMATGHPLEQVMLNMNPTKLSDGTFYYKFNEVLKYLGSYSIVCGIYFTASGEFEKKEKYTLSVRTELSDGPALLIVKSLVFKHATHFVFWDGNFVLDSLHDEPRAIENYSLVEIYPLYYFEEAEWSDEDLLSSK